MFTAPPIAYDKNGKPIKPPKACTAKELEKAQKDAAQSLKLADSLNAAALKLREASGKLRAQAVTASASSARVLGALANASDMAAQLLENKAEALHRRGVRPALHPAGRRPLLIPGPGPEPGDRRRPREGAPLPAPHHHHPLPTRQETRR